MKPSQPPQAPPASPLPHPASPLTPRQKLRSIIAASSGNLIEWFDFSIYAFLATYFAGAFSTAANPTLAQINAFGVFAAGSLMRPLGSWLFGSLADRVGRKKSMILSVVLMSLGSFIIALAPSAERIGDAALGFLLLGRLLQGLSAGGEYGIAATYLSELASPGRRGFYSSFQYVTLIGGQLLAVASISGLLLVLSVEEMSSFGWRILFALGGALGLASLLVRRVMDESARNLAAHADRGTLRALFSTSWRPLILVALITAGASSLFNVITIYSKTFAENAGLDRATVSHIFLLALFILMISQPLFGWLGDKIGHKNFLLIFALLALAGVYPLFSLIRANSTSPTAVLMAVLGLFFIICFYSSVSAIFKAKLFPEHIRALGTSLGYALPNAIFGGSSIWVALQFKKAGLEDGFFIYVGVLTGIMLVAVCLLPRRAELA